MRWAEKLASYNFQIYYHKGELNGKADTLSRRTEYKRGEKKPMKPVLSMEDGNMVLTEKGSKEVPVMMVSITEVKRAYQQDPRQRKLVERTRGFNKNDDGLVTRNSKIYLPDSLRDETVRRIHEDRLVGHPRIASTVELVTRVYYFPGMARVAKRVVQNCNECNVNKNRRHKQYGKMVITNTPTELWESIAMDFITDLPVN